FEARRRGLSDQLAAFPREESATADALWYADLTSGPTGRATTFEARVTEILTRYPPGSVVHESISAARPTLAAAVGRTRTRLAAHPRPRSVRSSTPWRTRSAIDGCIPYSPTSFGVTHTTCVDSLLGVGSPPVARARKTKEHSCRHSPSLV